MMATASNPWREIAQQRKAKAITRLIWAGLSMEDRTDPALPDRAAALSQGKRDDLAWYAGVCVLSQESWDLVVEELRERVADERRWRSLA